MKLAAPRALLPMLALACMMTAGCASPPRPPRDLDLSRAVIVSDPTPPTLTIPGPSGKGAAAGAGAAKGAGTGLTLGALACLGTGFLFPVCIATVVPTSTAIGAASWAAIAAVKAESAEGMALQREMLTRELVGGGHPARLAEQLQQAARQRLSIELPIQARDGSAEAPEWTIELALLELASDSHSEGQAYTLRIEGGLRLRRGDLAEPVYQSRVEARSDIAMTTVDWCADADAPLHAALSRSVRSLAEQFLSDLTRPGAERGAVAPPGQASVTTVSNR